MIRTAVAVLVCVLVISIAGFTSDTSLNSNAEPTSALKFESLTTKKNRQQRGLEKHLREAAQPLIQFKQAVERQLPQKELNTAKRLAFKLFLIARRYL